MCAKSPQLCPSLCDPVVCGPTGSSVHGILQARILERVAISSSRGSSQMEPMSPALQADSLPAEPQGSPRILEWVAISSSRGSSQMEPMSPALQVDSLPAEPQGSPRILEWVAISSSRGSSQPRDRTSISCSFCIAGGFFTTKPLGKHSLLYYIKLKK